MARWNDLEGREPEFARQIHDRFAAHRHSTLATVRRDGSPRISGTEVVFRDGDILLGMMPGSVKARDLRRDGRFALHSHSEDPPEEGEDQSAWSGDAKLAGRAVEVTGADGTWFRLDLTEAVLTRVGSPADHLVIESWHPERGYERRVLR